MMKRSFLSILLAVIALQVVGQVDLKKLDAYYAKALKEWDVPGMSIAIVKDGKIIFSKGYGVKEIGKNEAPDENTVYAIASNTKAFTTAIIGQLVDERKISWNDKVRKHLPYFELYDPWVSAETNIRDILSHRVGLREFGGDIVWYRSKLTSEQIIRRIRYLPKAYDFRSGYGYSNVMYITAGEIIATVTGKSWSENVHERFFKPLGMSRSVTSVKELEKLGNVASGHNAISGSHRPMGWEEWNHVAATGGIWSSVKDMSQWMMFNMNHGIWNNDTLFSTQVRNTLWTPHNSFTVNQTDRDNTVHLRGYALGWGVNDYHGRLRVGHTGGYSGFLSGVAMIPEEKLGVVVLTNGMEGIFGPIINYTLDAFLKAPQKDWSAEALAAKKTSKDTRIEERKAARVMGTKPSFPLEEYIGEYSANVYGKIFIKRDGDGLRLEFEHTPDLSAKLSHWHFDTFEIKWENPAELPWFSFGTIRFAVTNNAKVKKIEFDVPNDDFWFEELNADKIIR